MNNVIDITELIAIKKIREASSDELLEMAQNLLAAYDSEAN